MKPKCIHEPDVADGMCIHCDKKIEQICCDNCDGTGIEYRGSRVVDCRECGGDGVIEWREIKDDDGSDD